jgi:CHAD domain-containing protein
MAKSREIVGLIGTCFQRLQDMSTSFYHLYKIDKLHRTRIEAKRLRYAMELFASCLPELSDLAKEVAKLQSSLGEVHDYDEGIAMLGKRLHKEDDLLKRHAAYYLLNRFAKARTGCYRKALKR